MTACRERAVEILRGPDGERIWLALLDYAHKLTRRYGWRTDKTLPQGFSPGDVAKDVVIKVIEGDRTWDEAKEPNFLNALKGMVRSDLGHLLTIMRRRASNRLSAPSPTARRVRAIASAEAIPTQKRSSCTVSRSDWR
jgi:hypothetical protein